MITRISTAWQTLRWWFRRAPKVCSDSINLRLRVLDRTKFAGAQTTFILAPPSELPLDFGHGWILGGVVEVSSPGVFTVFVMRSQGPPMEVHTTAFFPGIPIVITRKGIHSIRVRITTHAPGPEPSGNVNLRRVFVRPYHLRDVVDALLAPD